MNTLLQRAILLAVCGALLIGNLLTGIGCFSVTAQAPYGRDVKVLSPEEPVEVRRSFQKWYILFGIIPLTPVDGPREIIEAEQLVEARVIVEDTLKDVIAGAIISILTIGIISPTTVVVEGNRAPLPSPSPAPPQ